MKLEDTLYEVLEVSPRASNEVIKAAYRCLAQHHHPDKNSGTDIANHTLAQINHAYSILSDPVTRLRYDRQIGLHGNSTERRGVGIEADGNYGSAVAGHSVSRPFGFRPL
jgi:curved DNA-binding protein CbpA